MLPIIDTHQHLWDLTRFRLPWVAGEDCLNRSFLIEEYLRETAGLGVQSTVYMEVDVAEEQRAKEADYVAALCLRPDNPMIGAVIGGRPASPEFESYIRRFSSPPYDRFVRGVRQVLHGGAPAGFCLQPDFVKSVRLLGELGRTFDICIRPGELRDAASLAESCPDTKFILDHCGNADVQAKDQSYWRRGIDLVAAQPNVACKVSGFIVTAKPGEWTLEELAPIVQHCTDAFGPDRIVFGGDWPVCTKVASLREWIGALREIIAAWPEEDQRKLLHDNAARVYGLQP